MIRFKFKEVLKEKRKSFYWLAKETGINQTTMSLMRHGKQKTLNLDYLSRICQTLEVQLGDLLYDDGKPSRAMRSKKSGPTRRPKNPAVRANSTVIRNTPGGNLEKFQVRPTLAMPLISFGLFLFQNSLQVSAETQSEF